MLLNISSREINYHKGDYFKNLENLPPNLSWETYLFIYFIIITSQVHYDHIDNNYLSS